MAITIVYHTLQSSPPLDYSDIKSGYQMSLDTGYRTAAMPTTLRGFAPYYNVSTAGAVSILDFLGKKIAIDESDTGGGGGIE